LKIKYTSQFKKDYKKVHKQNNDIEKLISLIEKLLSKEKLDPQFRDHLLSGERKKYRECHIAPDWLLIYKIDGQYLILARTGSHSELFKM